MKPMWAEIEGEIPELKTEYYDADEHPDLLKEKGIDLLPTFIFEAEDGTEILRLTGAQNKEELVGLVKENLQSN